MGPELDKPTESKSSEILFKLKGAILEILFSYQSFSNHFPLPRHWTRDRDIGPATATLDPRPRHWTRDPRPATFSQTRKERVKAKVILN